RLARECLGLLGQPQLPPVQHEPPSEGVGIRRRHRRSEDDHQVIATLSVAARQQWAEAHLDEALVEPDRRPTVRPGSVGIALAMEVDVDQYPAASVAWRGGVQPDQVALVAALEVALQDATCELALARSRRILARALGELEVLPVDTATIHQVPLGPGGQ